MCFCKASQEYTTYIHTKPWHDDMLMKIFQTALSTAIYTASLKQYNKLDYHPNDAKGSGNFSVRSKLEYMYTQKLKSHVSFNMLIM